MLSYVFPICMWITESPCVFRAQDCSQENQIFGLYFLITYGLQTQNKVYLHIV